MQSQHQALRVWCLLFFREPPLLPDGSPSRGRFNLWEPFLHKIEELARAFCVFQPCWMYSNNNLGMKLIAQGALQFNQKGARDPNERQRFLDILSTIAIMASTVRNRIIEASEDPKSSNGGANV